MVVYVSVGQLSVGAKFKMTFWLLCSLLLIVLYHYEHLELD